MNPRSPDQKDQMSVSRCRVCNHPGVDEINAMLLNAAPYKNIIKRGKAAYPEEPPLNEAALSRHFHRHLITKPIKTEELDLTTGDMVEGYLVGHLTRAMEVPKEVIPKDPIGLSDALKVIINAGIFNIMNNPGVVTPAVLVSAIDMARKMGIGGREGEEFNDAWAALNEKKNQQRRKRKRTVTLTEEVTDTTIPDDTIEVLPLPEGGWSEVIEGNSEGWSQSIGEVYGEGI